VYFFGRISGDEDDYYVAYVLIAGQIPGKRFFWATATSGFVFSDLPALNAAEATLARKERGFFRGKPAKILGLTDEEQEALEAEEAAAAEAAAAGEAPAAESGEGEGEPKKEEKPLRITELQRLSYVVKSIDFETSAVPVGAYIVNDDHFVISDSTFRGLSYSDAKSLNHWAHFRAPVDAAKAEALQAFLDPLTDDKPNGAWSIRSDAAANAVVVRSLLWPGYAAFHIPGTPHFGGAYFGDGRRNNDLAFLLL
jgi:radial spoke head protein 9